MMVALHNTGKGDVNKFLGQRPSTPVIGFDPPDWTVLALCAQTDPDMDVFFPEKGGSTRTAKAICGLCTVRVECLAFALGIEERSSYCYGVYGGVSARDRVKMLRDALGELCPTCGQRYLDVESHRRRDRICSRAAS